MTAHGTITFVPSVHFSPTHRRRVRDTIRGEEPDLVAVELDERRFERFERHTRLDPGQTDMETAVETAAELDIDLALIDEPITEAIAALSTRVGLETIPKMLTRAI